jgi:anti-sigma B factor antagonist
MLELKVVEEVADQHIRLALVGEFDTQGQTQVSAEMTALSTSFHRDTIVDMSGVTYISSMGIGMLLSINNALKRQGKRLFLLAPQPHVANVLQVTRLDSFLLVVTSEEQLQQALAAG